MYEAPSGLASGNARWDSPPSEKHPFPLRCGRSQGSVCRLARSRERQPPAHRRHARRTPTHSSRRRATSHPSGHTPGVIHPGGLLQAVAVQDHDQVIQRERRRGHCGLPNAALLTFAVADQHIGLCPCPVELCASAMPTPADNPCPREPVDASMPAMSRVLGSPPMWQFGFR